MLENANAKWVAWPLESFHALSGVAQRNGTEQDTVAQ